MADAANGIRSETAIQRFETVAGTLHTIVFLLLLAATGAIGYFSVQRGGVVHQPNRLLFYLTTMIWEWILFAYIYWGLRRHGKSFRNIAGESWKGARDFLRDLGIAFVFWIGAMLVISLLASVLRARGMAAAARLLAPRGVLESVVWVALAVTAGICEETMFRGYLQRQFVAWTRSAPVGVILSAVLFGAGHAYQGVRATVVIGVYGLMFGILAEMRKNLRPGMMAHAWHDIITGLIIRFIPVK
ncbi:MAG: type II CAAX endopeptidase family protein [Candidatus Acidiferrum sp.]